MVSLNVIYVEGVLESLSERNSSAAAPFQPQLLNLADTTLMVITMRWLAFSRRRRPIRQALRHKLRHNSTTNWYRRSITSFVISTSSRSVRIWCSRWTKCHFTASGAGHHAFLISEIYCGSFSQSLSHFIIYISNPLSGFLSLHCGPSWYRIWQDDRLEWGWKGH